MSAVATAIVGSAVVGAYVSDRSSRRAERSQRETTEQSNQLQRDMFEQQREDQAPWREAGEQSLAQLLEGTGEGGDFNRDFTMADFSADPGYEFRRSEGMRGIESRAAARGLLGSGGTLRDLTEYGSGLASQEYGAAYDRFNNNRSQRFNRLASIAGLGQTATNNVGAAGQRTAETIGNNLTNLGNAQGAAAISRGNAWSGAANTLGNFALSQYYMNNRPGSTGPAAGYWEAGGAGQQPTYVPTPD